MKRILLIILSLMLVLSLASSLAACSDDEADLPPAEDPNGTKVSGTETDKITNYVLFEMENGATFIVELLPEYAPQTVENFQQLVASHFYDGLTFYRITESFVQGGDPNGTVSGASESKLFGEFSSNGFTQNTLSHTRGVISMMRGTDRNSATSQFFVLHKDATSLDGNYAAFGRVVAGMETIDAIAGVKVTAQEYSAEKSKPVNPPVIKSAVFVELDQIVD